MYRILHYKDGLLAPWWKVQPFSEQLTINVGWMCSSTCPVASQTSGGADVASMTHIAVLSSTTCCCTEQSSHVAVLSSMYTLVVVQPLESLAICSCYKFFWEQKGMKGSWRSLVVLCPARTHLQARNSLVNKLGLLPKSGKDQWDCEISNIMQHFLTLLKFGHLHLSICTFFERVIILECF